MRKNNLAAASVLTFGALVACNGSTTGAAGTGSVSGTVAGTTFTVASEVAIIQAASGTSGSWCSVSGDGGEDAGCVTTSTSSGQMVAIQLSNRDVLACPAAQTPGAHDYANLDVLTLAAFVQTGALAAGTYDVTSSGSVPSGAIVQFETSTSTCGLGVNSAASTGSITLTEVSSTSVTGTYSVTFGTEGTFSGSFDLPICAQVDAGASTIVDAGLPVCAP